MSIRICFEQNCPEKVICNLDQIEKHQNHKSVAYTDFRKQYQQFFDDTKQNQIKNLLLQNDMKEKVFRSFKEIKQKLNDFQQEYIKFIDREFREQFDEILQVQSSLQILNEPILTPHHNKDLELLINLEKNYSSKLSKWQKQEQLLNTFYLNKLEQVSLQVNNQISLLMKPQNSSSAILFEQNQQVDNTCVLQNRKQNQIEKQFNFSLDKKHSSINIIDKNIIKGNGLIFLDPVLTVSENASVKFKIKNMVSVGFGIATKNIVEKHQKYSWRYQPLNHGLYMMSNEGIITISGQKQSLSGFIFGAGDEITLKWQQDQLEIWKDTHHQTIPVNFDLLDSKLDLYFVVGLQSSMDRVSEIYIIK